VSTLTLCADQLYEIGYENCERKTSSQSTLIISRQMESGMFIAGTSRTLACLRWLVERSASKILWRAATTLYGIADRVYVLTFPKRRNWISKSWHVCRSFTNMSLRLQAAFVLRLAESIKITAWADRGDTRYSNQLDQRRTSAGFQFVPTHSAIAERRQSSLL